MAKKRTRAGDGRPDKGTAGPKAGAPKDDVPVKAATPHGDTPAKGAPAQESPEQAIDEASSEGVQTPAGKDAQLDDAPLEKTGSPPTDGHEHAPPTKQAWGAPIARFEERWTWLESRLITFVLVWQLLALVAWVFLAGLSSPLSSGNAAGMVFRAVAGALVLGLAAWIGLKAKPLGPRRAATLVAIAVGLAVAPLWRSVGVDYFDNVKGWLQEGSMLTLMGGLRGLATRLTLWLALLGASLATAAGKHIHIDVIFRFLPTKLRLPAAVLNFSAAALMCFAAAWGFFDHIAIESFGSKADDAKGAKVAQVAHHMERHAFLMGKQIGLDLWTLPHVLAGDRYDRWMPASEWNEWVKDAGFEAHYSPEEVKGLIVPDDGPPHGPLVIAPDGETARGILVHSLNLVFPFGLLVIGLRFLLRILLAASGHIDIDPDAAHKADIPGGDGPEKEEPAAAAREGLADASDARERDEQPAMASAAAVEGGR